ncbi:FAD binding domain-containing protein [Lacisediminimonas profundi]|uniref:FAD binding domain-containing protein n=1 Tax=Lacisediminimonas profundi TaxID=2603856 RepID=UPI00124AF399|nr:xanthine dehydrogenase family protein subunit M [Lacisediminimonas profundi]
MKPPRFQYEAPTSLEQALSRLAELGPDARLLAGGQSLVPAMNLRLANPAHVIDLRLLTDLQEIEQLADGTIRAGAMTRHVDFERSELLAECMPLVPAVMRKVAHPQIRHRGTIGGSLAHADPAAEWPALAMALDASIVLQSTQGQRRLKAEDFFRQVYSTALQPDEMIVAVEFPAWPPGRGWGFEEVSRRTGDFAMAGVICTLDLDQQRRCIGAQCIIFAASDKPFMLDAASDLLAGQQPGEDLIAQVARAARAAVSPLGDHHASSEYRLELVEVLTARALKQACALQ